MDHQKFFDGFSVQLRQSPGGQRDPGRSDKDTHYARILIHVFTFCQLPKDGNLFSGKDSFSKSTNKPIKNAASESRQVSCGLYGLFHFSIDFRKICQLSTANGTYQLLQLDKKTRGKHAFRLTKRLANG